MIGYGALDPYKPIFELLNRLDKGWYDRLHKEFESHDTFDPESETVYYEYILGIDEDRGEIPWGHFYTLPEYSWAKFDGRASIYEARDFHLCGIKVFSEIVLWVRDTIFPEIGASGKERVSAVKKIMSGINYCLLENERKAVADRGYVAALAEIRKHGLLMMEKNFVNLFEFGVIDEEELKLDLNINQDHFAYFLAVLKRGGLIATENQSQIAAFAERSFRVLKEGDTKYSSIKGMRPKFNEFFNSKRPESEAKQRVEEIINKGISNIKY